MTAAVDPTLATPPPLVVQPPHTPQDVMDLEKEGLFELVAGRLVEKKMSARSSKAAGELTFALVGWARRAGAHVFPEQTYQCFPHEPTRIRRPDVSVVLAGRFPDEALPEGHVKVRPDIAIEVISPNDLVVDLQEKLDDYIRAEIPLVWIVYPEARRVEVRPLRGTIRVLDTEATLTADDVLPGFAVRVGDLFPPATAAAPPPPVDASRAAT